MDFFDLLTMLGGLALFLYGMSMLGDGLAKISGGKLEQILGKLTAHPLKAVAVGAGVTAVIQSSSATTVMVVGFVNSGIMKLQQAAGIIIGANIGTTITSWILGAAGIDSSSFLVRLCKPTSFSPVLALVGVGILLFSHRDRRKNVAYILLGFAILMMGMDTMSSAVKPLADVPEFTGILTRFSHPVPGMLAGLVLTALLQSSSASVGILQALCVTGAIGYDAAVPIIMGQNIGTCITAVLSGMGGSRNARRASLIHLYFNVIGTALFMILFYGINGIAPFGFMEQKATAFGIAAIHSVFNVTAALCLLPFRGGLVKLACLTIRERGGNVSAGKGDANGGQNVTGQDGAASREMALQRLDPRFLEIPAYAVEVSREVAVTMAGLARQAMTDALGLVGQYTPETGRQVKDLECAVDHFEDGLGDYLVKLGSKDLAESDSYTLSVLLHCIGDFERISDHASNIAEAAREMAEKEMSFSPKAWEELQIYSRAVRDILEITMDSFQREDLELAREVEPLEEVIDSLNREIRKRHVKRLRKGKCTIDLGFVLSDLITNYERVADHCSNIAVSLLQAGQDAYDPHAYLDRVRQADDLGFQGRVMVYGERYRLP